VYTCINHRKPQCSADGCENLARLDGRCGTHWAPRTPTKQATAGSIASNPTEQTTASSGTTSNAIEQSTARNPVEQVTAGSSTANNSTANNAPASSSAANNATASNATQQATSNKKTLSMFDGHQNAMERFMEQLPVIYVEEENTSNSGIQAGTYAQCWHWKNSCAAEQATANNATEQATTSNLTEQGISNENNDAASSDDEDSDDYTEAAGSDSVSLGGPQRKRRDNRGRKMDYVVETESSGFSSNDEANGADEDAENGPKTPPQIVMDQLSAADMERFSSLRQSEPNVHPHATYFARMCDQPMFEMNIGTTQTGGNENTARAARIRKALFYGMHEGTGRLEAEHALRVARNLMVRYNMTEDDIKKKLADEVPGRARKVQFFKGAGGREPLPNVPRGDWHMVLSRLISDVFNVKHYMKIDREKIPDGSRERKTSGYVFYGPPDEVDQAALAFEMAANRIVWLSRVHEKKQNVGFMLGIAEGIKQAEEEELKVILRHATGLEKNSRQLAKQYRDKVCNIIEKRMGVNFKKRRSSHARLDESARRKGQKVGEGQRVTQNTKSIEI
jgi:hypothetical protein